MASESKTRCMDPVLIAGAIASGKSTVARGVADALAGEVVLVPRALAEVTGVSVGDRVALQLAGAELDRRTNGRWLAEFLEQRGEFYVTSVVDSVRTRRQAVPILTGFPLAVLVYLDARPETRRHRFDLGRATDPVKRSLSFVEAMRHQTEIEVVELRPMAHLVVETDHLDVSYITAEIVSVAKKVEAAGEARRLDGGHSD